MRHALAVLTAGLVLGGLVTANAQNSTVFPTNVYYMSKSAPAGTLPPYSAGGGVPAQALIAAPGITNSVWSFSWYGMRGWSTVQGSTDLVNWVNLAYVAATNYAWTTTNLNTLGASASFRLSQNNSYVGASACVGCHADKVGWTNTAHSRAVSLLSGIGAVTNANCLRCHTTGFGQPSGYTNQTLTPNLANVGCENCHGPAGWHKASEKDMITPAVSLDPAICGSCHQTSFRPTYLEYTNVNYTAASNAPMGVLLTGASHLKVAGSSSLGCSVCHAANNRMAMIKEYYDRLAGNPHPVTLFTATGDAQAFGAAACAICHDPHTSTNYARMLRYPTFSTNWFAVPGTQTDPTPVLTTNSNGTIITNSTSAVANNTIFDSFYNPNIQVCGQCHSGGRGMRWDGSAYGLITNLVYSTNVTQAGYVQVPNYVTNVEVFTNISYPSIYTNGAWTIVTNITIATNSYVFSYVTNQVWTASVTNFATNTSFTVGAYYPLIPYTNNGTRYTSTNSSNDKSMHYPVQYNVLIGQLDYDLAARGGPPNVLTDAHTRSPNQCADCHVPSYPVNPGTPGTNVTGHKFVCDYNGLACQSCHNMNSNQLAADTLNFKVSVSNSMVRVVSLLRQWGTNVAPGILATNYGPLSWEYPSISSYFSTKATNVVNGATKIFSVGPPTAYSSSVGVGYPSGTNDNVQLNYVPQDIRMIRFSLYALYWDQSYGVHNPTYTSNLLAWAENDVITNQFIAAGWPTFSANVVSGTHPLTVQFSNTGSGSVYSWTFGDGGTASTSNPTYIYNNPGTNTVTCTVDGKSLTRTLYISVQ